MRGTVLSGWVRTAAALAGLGGAALAGAGLGCSSAEALAPGGDAPASDAQAGTASAAPTAPAATTPAVRAFNEVDALAYPTKSCAGCHGYDAQGNAAPYHSSWQLPEGALTREWLETSESTPAAYQSVLHAIRGTPGLAPSPMPPGAHDAEALASLRGIAAWFHEALPLAVADANARYGNDAADAAQIALSFRCKTTATLRTFLTRVTFGAFDRPPRAAETALFGAAALDRPVTPEQRAALVARLGGEWREELVKVGLRKLANVIGGAPGIKTSAALSPELATDLKSELYELLRARYDAWDYPAYFASNEVMATTRTAAEYGCAAPANGWAPCALQAPRGGFFTTLGFLSSKPQSFLQESNNHGRVASLYFTIYGEALKAATTGPTGAVDVPALPSCLEATDTRAFQGAPRGSAAIPMFGQVCQGCHVARPMAAGSVLFRPFASNGKVYTAATLGAAGSPDAALFAAATTAADWTYRTAPTAAPLPVNAEFLRGLLSAPPKACVATGNPKAPFTNVSSVGELAAALMANEGAVARGFMRHAQRAFANQTAITLEMGVRAGQAFESKKKKLPDLVAAYFGSESFSCDVEGSP